MSKENKDDTAKEAEPKAEEQHLSLNMLIETLLESRRQEMGITDKALEAHRAFHKKLLALIEEHNVIWGNAVDDEDIEQSISATLMYTGIEALFDAGDDREEIARKLARCIASSLIHRKLNSEGGLAKMAAAA